MAGQAVPICAVITARNEAACLRGLLPLLAAQAIDVALIDHGSTDGSAALYRQHQGSLIVALEHLPYTGVFSLKAQLAAKTKLMARLSHPWLVHLDADEWLEHRDGVGSLRACIEEAQAQGYNALNFEEFVFLPPPASTTPAANPQAHHHTYYYFAPHPNRLHRAFRRELAGASSAQGGHVLVSGALRLSPTSHVLRHYIGLSEAHLQRKYASRSFCPKEVAQGWHRSRLAIAPEALRIPRSSPYLRQLRAAGPPQWDRSCPARQHYWLWPQAERSGC